jgi:hypothetical protein
VILTLARHLPNVATQVVDFLMKQALFDTASFGSSMSIGGFN